MSLVTANTLDSVRRTQLAYTEDVVRQQLHKGLAPVVERDRPGIAITWSFAPNDPAYGLGYLVRDTNRDSIEGITR